MGVLLAKALGYGFLDTDLVIQQQEGALLQEILDEKGVPYFLDAEERAVRSVECDRHVIAPGGSVVCREGAIAHLKAAGPVIYLRVPLEELKARIHNLDSRGIALEPGQTLEDIMDLRAPLYERYADAGGGRRPRTVHGPDRLLSARAPGTAGSGPHLARPQPTGNRGPAPEGRFSGGRMKRRK